VRAAQTAEIFASALDYAKQKNPGRFAACRGGASAALSGACKDKQASAVFLLGMRRSSMTSSDGAGLEETPDELEKPEWRLWNSSGSLLDWRTGVARHPEVAAASREVVDYSEGVADGSIVNSLNRKRGGELRNLRA